MWRGGLSGVDSLYLHSDRPLISGNRTSALLHEVFHVASGLHGKAGADWIVEGLAEYYSLALLLRSGGISERRFNEAFDTLAQWSAETECVPTDRSQGQQTARAALVMRALDVEIRAATGDKESLDTLVQMLVHVNRTVTNEDFRSAAKDLIKGPVRALASCP
jgi:predicted metalloprotease with PDZ domain